MADCTANGPDGAVCSGHGDCVPLAWTAGASAGGRDSSVGEAALLRYVCACHDGYSSLDTAFVWGANDCALHTATMRVVHVVLFALTLLATGPSLYHLLVTRLYRQRQSLWTFPTRMFALYAIANVMALTYTAGMAFSGGTEQNSGGSGDSDGQDRHAWVMGRHVGATVCFMAFNCSMGVITLDMAHHFAAFWLRVSALAATVTLPASAHPLLQPRRGAMRGAAAAVANANGTGIGGGGEKSAKSLTVSSAGAGTATVAPVGAAAAGAGTGGGGGRSGGGSRVVVVAAAGTASLRGLRTPSAANANAIPDPTPNHNGGATPQPLNSAQPLLAAPTVDPAAVNSSSGGGVLSPRIISVNDSSSSSSSGSSSAGLAVPLPLPVSTVTPPPPVAAAPATPGDHHGAASVARASAAVVATTATAVGDDDAEPLRAAEDDDGGRAAAARASAALALKLESLPRTIHLFAPCVPVLHLVGSVVAYFAVPHVGDRLTSSGDTDDGTGTGTGTAQQTVTLIDASMERAAVASLVCWAAGFGVAMVACIFAISRVRTLLSLETRSSPYLAADPAIRVLVRALALMDFTLRWVVAPVVPTILVFAGWGFLRHRSALLVTFSLITGAPACPLLIGVFGRGTGTPSSNRVGPHPQQQQQQQPVPGDSHFVPHDTGSDGVTEVRVVSHNPPPHHPHHPQHPPPDGRAAAVASRLTPPMTARTLPPCQASPGGGGCGGGGGGGGRSDGPSARRLSHPRALSGDGSGGGVVSGHGGATLVTFSSGSTLNAASSASASASSATAAPVFGAGAGADAAGSSLVTVGEADSTPSLTASSSAAVTTTTTATTTVATAREPASDRYARH